ncbi:hypothetical protein AB0K51_32895 [Kitasatospora sp. NPDC049285]|uniref:hypothetical protein n=1 Tax=Kitasatospora sp. NPDC049285 TaxID=3157096 RepID=UPI0034325D8D
MGPVIMNSPFSAAWWATLLRPLHQPGYRGPLVLSLLLTAIALAPEGIAHDVAAVGLMAAGMFLWVPSLLLSDVAVPLAVATTAAVAALVAVPAVQRALRRLGRPGDSVLLGCAFAAAAILLGFSIPGQDVGLLGAGVLTLLVLPFAWLARQIHLARRGRDTASHRVGTGRLPGLLRWTAAPLLLVGTVLLVHHDVPQQARFALARPALTSYAEQILSAETTAGSPDHAAGYLVQDAQLVDGGMKFAITGSGFFAHHGYAYFPSGAPASVHRSWYEHLDGPWYRWSGPDHL